MVHRSGIEDDGQARDQGRISPLTLPGLGRHGGHRVRGHTHLDGTLGPVAARVDGPFLLNRTSAGIRDHGRHRILTFAERKDAAEFEISVRLAKIAVLHSFGGGSRDSEAFAQNRRLTIAWGDAHERSNAAFFAAKNFHRTLDHESSFEAKGKIQKGMLRANAAVEFFTFDPFVENVLELPGGLRVEWKLRASGS